MSILVPDMDLKMEQNRCENHSKNLSNFEFIFLLILVPFLVDFGSNLGVQGGSDERLLEVHWKSLWLLGLSWGQLGQFGPVWGQLKPTWGQLGTKLGPTWSQLGPTWDQLGANLKPTWSTNPRPGGGQARRAIGTYTYPPPEL